MGGLARIDLDVPFYLKLMTGKCIGLGGKLGSGKTFLADCLVNYINSQQADMAVRRSFADQLRNHIENEIGIPVKRYKHNFDEVDSNSLIAAKILIMEHCDSVGIDPIIGLMEERLNSCVTYNDVYRFSLQHVGTELYRNQVDNDYWAKSIANTLDVNKITVIDDARFLNELGVVDDHGISTYVIALTEYMKSVDDKVEKHGSETSVMADHFRMIYYNFIDRTHCDELLIGKSLFNYVFAYYYMFIELKSEPNKEFLFVKTIKNA